MQQPTLSSNYSAKNFSSTKALNIVIWLNRLALALVFIWFGYLKVIHVSPAEGLVQHLHSVTIVHYIPINVFITLLGMLEIAVGVFWLFPKLTKLAFLCFIAHMFTTFLPLFFLPGDTWQHAFVLTLTGQYIVKNVVLITSAVTIWFIKSSSLA